jgi:hypothetical protein
MKVFGALLAAVSAVSFIFTSEFLLEDLLAHQPLSIGLFLFGFVLNMLVGLPAALVGGIPIWYIFRRQQVYSPLAFALAGACLAFLTYLLLVAAGMGQPSDHPITFTQNLGRSFHIPRIAFATLAGACGSDVFRRIAVSRPKAGAIAL